MSRKITKEKLEDFILQCINNLEVGESIEFTREDKNKTLEKGESFSDLTKIILSKIDDERFTITVKEKKVDKEDRVFPNLGFDEVIKKLLKLEKEKFGDLTHFFVSKN